MLRGAGDGGYSETVPHTLFSASHLLFAPVACSDFSAVLLGFYKGTLTYDYQNWCPLRGKTIDDIKMARLVIFHSSISFLLKRPSCSFWKKKKRLFININLFLTVLGLCCCAQAFSTCGEQGLLFSQASYCCGFSCCRAWAVGCAGFSSCGLWA